MIGGTKNKVKKLVCAGIVGLVILAGYAKDAGATLVDSNSIVRDGIEYYIQTNKSVYDLGEDVEILYRVTNLTDNPVSIGEKLLFAPDYDVIITDDGDNQVWMYLLTLQPPVPIPGTTMFHLEPHESKEYQTIWDMINDNGTSWQSDDFPVAPGVYNITGELFLCFWEERVPVTLDIEIIPEPCSLALLGLGLASLLVRKKGRAKCSN